MRVGYLDGGLCGVHEQVDELAVLGTHLVGVHDLIAPANLKAVLQKSQSQDIAYYGKNAIITINSTASVYHKPPMLCQSSLTRAQKSIQPNDSRQSDTCPGQSILFL